MASNNTSYPYQQRPSQGQGFPHQDGFSRPSQEYSTGTHRWQGYPAPQDQYEQPQHRQSQHQQASSASRSGGGRESTGTQDSAMGRVSTSGTTQGTTRTASPAPTHDARQNHEFSGYSHYIGSTIASRVQSYAQQTPTPVANMTTLSSSGPSSRACTATATQPFNGYQYTGQLGQTVTPVAEMALPYRPSGARVEEYFNYSHEPTTAASAGYGGAYQTADTARTAVGYDSVYQTVDGARNTQAAASGYSPLYQSDAVLQTAVPGYEPVHQTQQAGRQEARTVTPVQTQRQSQQSSHIVTSVQTQHQTRTVTPSQTQYQASRTVTPTPAVQQPQQPQYGTFPPAHHAPTPNMPQRNTATPPTPATTHQPTSQPAPATKTPRPKPRPRVNDMQSRAPPASGMEGFISGNQAQREVYKRQQNVSVAQNTARLEGMSQAPWEEQSKKEVEGQVQGMQQTGHLQKPHGQAQSQAVQTPQVQQLQSWRNARPSAVAQQVPVSQPQPQLQPPEQSQMYNRSMQPQPQHHHHHHHHHHHMPPTSAAPSLSHVAQPMAQPLQYQPQSYPESQHLLPQGPQLQTQGQGQIVPPAQLESPREPARAPSEPRAPSPINTELMEQHMKAMVERMRHYQAADPVKFQAVWDNVRKNSGMAITAGNSSHGGGNERQERERKAIMPATTGGSMVRSESLTSERTVVYTPSQIPQIPLGNTKPDVAMAVGGEEVDTTPHRQAQLQQVENNPATVPQAHNPRPHQWQTQHASPPPPAAQAPQPSISPPFQPDAMHIRTAKAVSKYLVETSGKCLPEEVIIDLLHRIKSFPALCDKLEAMGYRFHRGSFSRFLLAEVDGSREEVKEKEEKKGAVTENMEITDKGESRVLGEVEDDQVQIMREVNDSRNRESQAGAGSPVIQSATGEGRLATPVGTNVDHQQAKQLADITIGDAPKTPTLPITAQRITPPTPMSATPTVPVAPTDGATANPTPIFRPNTRQPSHTQPQSKIYTPLPPSQQSPSPGLDYAQRHPTPQSVKAAHTAPPRGPEIKQFVSPSLVYRPPTPPSIIIDVDTSPSPPPAETYSPAMTEETEASPLLTKIPVRGRVIPVDVEMGDYDAPSTNQYEQRTSPRSTQNPQHERSHPPRPTKIVKLHLGSLKLLGRNMPTTNSSPPAVAPPNNNAAANKIVTIDLTSSATPELQMSRPSQPPASAPDFRRSREPERQFSNPPVKSSEPFPVQRPVSIPQSAPAKQGSAATIPIVLPLSKTANQMKPLKKAQYDPATIARDIQIATGRNPQWARPLNAHLDVLRLGKKSFHENGDLETVRWDILDPDPVGSVVGYDAGIDDDDGDGGFGEGTGEGGGFDSVGVAVARQPVMFGNPVAMKGVVGQATILSPTPVGRDRGKRVGKHRILGSSVLSFQNSEHGFTTASGGTGSAEGRKQVTSTNDNGNSNGDRTNGNSPATTGGGSWGGFSVPAPRSSSRSVSGLRNVATPDGGVGSGNFAVVIRSPSVSSVDRSRVQESANAKGLKRKLDSSDKGKGTPARKKINKPTKEKLPPKAREEDVILELKPSGFKVFKCKWKFCNAELHNFETLHRHVIKAHRKLASYGGYPCHWEGCSRSPTKEMRESAVSNRGLGRVVLSRITWDFDTPEQWETHVVQSHLESVKNEIGVGPSVGPFDHEAVSDVDYLSDSFGRQITPVARLAPLGHVFLPPPGYEPFSPRLALIRRTRALGAGMEGDEAADLRENDNGDGIGAIVRRIVAVEDGVIGLQAASPSQGAKAKGKGKERAVEEEKQPLENLGKGSNHAGPSKDGGFTVYDDEELYL